MKTNLLLIWYYLETRYTKLLQLFNITHNPSVIHPGMYCYTWDNERQAKEPCTDGSYWIKLCPYYRSTPKTKGIACTYTGYFGFDECLYDQCKICGENKDFNDTDII